MTAKRGRYVADFETTTNPEDCRVWGFGIMNVFKQSSFQIGTDINDFMLMCERIKADVYFHNLKFDGSFIVNWLYRNGFEYSDDPRPKTFNTTISEFNQWYRIQVVYDVTEKGRAIHTTFYDSLKKLPFKVEEIAKMYDLEVEKLEIDYKMERAHDHVLTIPERKYIYHDIKIMAEALKLQFLNGLQSMTIGADALKEFKKIVNKDNFKFFYPVFNEYLDKDIRKAYKGGFTWLNPKYKGKEIKNGISYDVNSLYPYIMYEKPLPYGIPIFFEGQYKYDDDYPLFIQHLKINFEIKEGHIPTIQIKKSLMFSDVEYLESSDGLDVDIYVTNIDLKLIFEHYHIYHMEFISGWKFKKVNDVFSDYIDKWTKIKEESTGGKRLLAKLMLNSLYGKFATNTNMKSKIPKFSDEKIVMVDGKTTEKDAIYTPVSVFVTSYAREYTIRTAQSCYDRIIYCDTDSIHLTGLDPPPQIENLIDPKKLGFWKYEGAFKRGKYLRAKSYIHESENNDLKVVCAGMTDTIKEKVTFDNFEIGLKLDGKLMPKQVKNGVVLVETTFTLK